MKNLILFFILLSNFCFSQKTHMMELFEKNYYVEFPCNLMKKWENVYYKNISSRTFFQIILQRSAKWEELNFINSSEREKQLFLLKFESFLMSHPDLEMILYAKSFIPGFQILNSQDLQIFFQCSFEKRIRKKPISNFKLFNNLNL